MPSLTSEIEKYIHDMLQAVEDDYVLLRRKELAKTFGCVPSQINYVLRQRFTPEHGFLVESQRGEHGYIRIFRVACSEPEDKLQHIEDIVGDAITERDSHNLLQALQERGLITARERLIIEVALRHSEDLGRDDFDVSSYKRAMIKADLLKKMLRGLMLA